MEKLRFSNSLFQIPVYSTIKTKLVKGHHCESYLNDNHPKKKVSMWIMHASFIQINSKEITYFFTCMQRNIIHHRNRPKKA